MKSVILYSLIGIFSSLSLADKVYEGSQCKYERETLSFEANTKTDQFLITNIIGEDTQWISLLNPWNIIKKDDYKIVAKTNFRAAMEKAGSFDSLLLLGASLVSLEAEIDISSDLIWLYAKVDPSYFSNNGSRNAVNHFIRETGFLQINPSSVNIASFLYDCGSVKMVRDFEEEKRLAQLEEERIRQLERIRENQNEKLILLGSGTGFYISEDGYLVTNYHVVEGCKEIKDRKENLEMIITDPITDIAVLKSETPAINYIPLSTTDASRAEEIYVVGYPYGKGISSESKTTKGIVSSLQGAENNYAQFQIDAAIQPGNSGGPIVNEQGNLVGIVVSAVNYEYIIKEFNSIQPPQNFNFGIKVSMLKNILSSNEIGFSINEPSFFDSLFMPTTNEKIENTINATAYLECIGSLSDTTENKIAEHKLMKSSLVQ